MKDIRPDKDLGPFSKAYTEAMTFMDTSYIFIRCLLDDVAGIAEYFYKVNGSANLPQSFSDLLKKSEKRGVPQELISLLQSCREWFPELKKERDGIIHDYETKLIGFVKNPKKGGVDLHPILREKLSSCRGRRDTNLSGCSAGKLPALHR